ncbi:phosphoribosylaminoimidazolesuccinocarboxamide synthase [Cryptococcus wingfieldii CBS 7118]|uniref:Tyrosine--tRNA ligase n=1 Tax=Cryptococcus wingfieldii CBS 7118 TaxID=1295528 RepID=A0A1E3K778_9TREE|nr:phosphoribosylaminoimidazolesuccinocarboxamide synthase [Cryptococcus wingfieldii CBS 7118]ODO08776.1 phosphoribosylaminoimidazolesuccinocarboxamide synthase [Cryptococcus wingfieldii CBS 7118]
MSAQPDTIKLSPEAESQYERITRNLQEVTSADVIRKVLSEDKVVKAYWGTAPTGRPHIAYCVPLLKIADFLTAGVNVKVLLAGKSLYFLHAFLDASKSTLETVQYRVKYYATLLKTVFTALGVPTDKLEFITGSSYQLKADYTLDVYKFHALTSTREAEHAGADVVKESESPLMSSLLYPGLQALDEEYLGVDFQFGGVDQRKIFMYASHFLPRLGYAKRAHLMNGMVPGLSGGKMSASDPKSKIDFLDTAADVKSKIKNALCPPGEIENNGVIAFIKTVLLPIQALKIENAANKGEKPPVGGNSFVFPGAPEGTIFSISRPEKFGGDIHFKSYEELEKSYIAGDVHPGDLKTGVQDALIKFLGPIREAFDADKEWQEIERQAYPSSSAAPKVEEKKSKKKDARSKPPTEEERAALRAAKEKEKAAKEAAKAVNEGTALPVPPVDKTTPSQLVQGSKAAVAASGVGTSTSCVTSTHLPKLKLLAKGKVRDIYALPGKEDEDKLLFVATDRMSAFDVIMNNGIPSKGITLTTLSLFWFEKLKDVIPNHVIHPSPSSCFSTPAQSWDEFPRSLDEYRDQLEGRSMIVKKCEVVKIEAIVRGYITGSAWSEYKKSQTVHGIQMPAGLVESEQLPKPLFTPSTKADQGEHDENIHPDKVKDICGPELAVAIEEVAIKLYSTAAAYAKERGLILADTKFEFGLLPNPASPNNPSLILIDEVLTPDSSRYWSAAEYTAGKPQASFDKQYLRDWLIKEGLKGKDGVTLPNDVVGETRKKYEEARDRVMGLGEFGKHGRVGQVAGDEVALQTDQAADAIEDEARQAL